MSDYPDFPWDESQAVTLHGKEAQQAMNEILMRAADDAPTVEEALYRLKTGRPRVEESSETAILNIRVPKSWLDMLDAQAKRLGSSRSQLARDILHRGMQPA
ncbi:hypothetical protein ACFQY8_03350 [Alloscardovia venturai]|uniref:Ribbon-helix-helix protein CopG domain-containing protein n=1 Tax=Alloscardovia venturai TaxID=1769421 RepID=A0ABW2Y3E4_9BIFI